MRAPGPRFGSALRVLGAAVVALGAASQAPAAPRPPDLAVLEAVSEAVATGRQPPPAEGDLPSALASALVARASGREERAVRLALEAIRSTEPPEPGESRAAFEAALWLTLLAADPAPEVRAELAARGGPIGDAVFALLQAREERCTRAVESADALAASAEGPLPRLLAEVYRRCGRIPDALALLRRADSGDPRIQREIGWTLLAAGDAPSAAVWCHRAAAGMRGLPSERHEAERCASVADALAGRMPSAREEYAAALEDWFRDPLAPAPARRNAGLAAAWVRLSAGTPEDARRALAIVEELEGNRDARSDPRLPAIRAMALAATERDAAAVRELARARGAGCLHLFASGFVAARQQDGVAASAAYGRAAACARAEGNALLAAAVGVELAELAAEEGRPQSARHHVEEALADWSVGPFADPLGAPLADPGLPRRAIDVALSALRAAPGGAESAEAVTVAERFRLALAGDEREPLDPGRLRRHLAARNGALLYLVVGEDRTFAWLVEPGAVLSTELPSGSELAERLSESAEAEPPATAIVGNLLGGLSAGSALLVIPDGLLAGVPWHDLAVIEPTTGARRPLGETFELTLMPGLAEALAPGGARTQALTDEPTFLALTAEADPLLNRLLTLPALARLANVRVARLSPPAADALHQQLRGRHALLHVRLPLLAGGRTVVVGLPGGTAAALDEEIGRATQVDLVTLDPAGGFVEAPASRVRGAERLVERGARAALVPLEPLPEDWAPEFWEKFYTELGRGRRKTEALRRALAGRRPAVHFVLLGHADTRVVPPLRVLWPVWAALGAVLVVLSVVLLRVLRRPQDPFDIEPPEEPEEQAEGA